MPSSPGLRRLKQGAAALGSVALALGGFVGFLHTPFGHEWLRSKAEARLGDRINGSAQIGGLTFSLKSGITLHKILLRDLAGAEVVAVEEAHVDPSFQQLVRGKIDLEEVNVRGLRLRLAQLPEGGTNLSKLFGPKPGAKPEPPKPPSKPLDFLRLSQVRLTDGDVELKRLDGSWLSVKGIAVEARMEVSPARKDVDAVLTKMDASLVLQRPDGQQVTLSELHTGLEAKLQGGAGQVKLLPLGALLGFQFADGRKVDPTPIALAGLSVGLSSQQITAGLHQLELLALQVGTVDAQVGVASGAPDGTGQGVLGGVRLDRDRVNALLGKPLLASHVDLDARLDGSKDKPHLNFVVKTEGGSLQATVRLDTSRLAKPQFAIDLRSEGLQVHRAVQLPRGTEIGLGALTISVQGEATRREDATANITLDLGASKIRGTAVEKVHAEARYEGGVLTIQKLSVEALGQRLNGRGTYTPTTRSVEAWVEARGDLLALGKALADAGRNPPPPALLQGVNLREGLIVEVRGSLDSALDVALPSSRIGVAGGIVTVEGKGRLQKGVDPSDPSRMVLEEGGASMLWQGVSIPSLLAMLGRPDRGLRGHIDGAVQVQGTRISPSATYDLQVTVNRGASSIQAHARGKASPTSVALELDADKMGQGPPDRLLHAEIKAPLVVVDRKPRLDPERPLAIRVDVPSRTVASLSGLLPLDRVPPPLQGSTLGASAVLSGSARAPEGTLRLDAQGPLAAKLGGTQKIHADISLAPREGGSVTVAADLSAWLREDDAPHLTSKLTARLGVSPLIKRPEDADWTLDTTLQPYPLAALAPGGDRRGTVGLRVEASGNRSDVQAKIAAALRGLGPEKSPPLDVDVALTMDEERTSLGVNVRGNGEELASLDGKIGLGGRALIPRVHNRKPLDLNTPFDLLLTIPERALASLAPWAPKLAQAPGILSGKVELQGPAPRASLRGGISLRDLPTADGSLARAEVNLSGSPLQLGVRLDARPAQGQGISVEVHTPTLALLNTRGRGGTFPVFLTVHAQSARLSTLFPPTSLTRAMEGIVDSDFRAQLDVTSVDGVTRPSKVTFQGDLKLSDGSFQIPGASRTLHGLGFQLSGDGDSLHLQKLELHESDREQSDRSILASGQVVFDGTTPREATLDLKTSKWLVHGGNFGPTDAPRGSLDADLGVRLAFGPEGRKIQVKIRSLELLAPDRFLRAHQQEQASLGDVLEIQGGVAIGKLPVPTRTPAPEPSPAVAEGAEKRATEIEIELPPTAHVKQAPLDLQLTGVVRVRLLPGERHTEGKLAVIGGSILMGGRPHQVEGGELRFDEENPGGYFDIYFRRSPHPAALRGVATEEGEVVRIHLTGPLGKQKPSYEGLGLGSLFDAIAINNAGRTRYLAHPDMPTSQTAQLPQYAQLRQITYMAVNLPHLLFLDRISVWADPYDDRSSYGRLVHHQAERYDVATRLRTATRAPRGVGQSEGEVAYDWLFQNTSRILSGIGMKVGTRGGGGPEVFWEWSSKE
ncbi:MAG: hypothetical protein RMJ98_01185 [Myxococcales bacterium]|nr:hypothetical protein [Polyangiaceae bacterium]MDW8247900.1 hypothetical protein [Myxococcales bacterium]